jgi:hypothetical protein
MTQMAHQNLDGGIPTMPYPRTPTPPAAEFPNLFNEAMGRLSPDDVYVINPDEYAAVADVSNEDARDLPDGLYVVGQTARERLGTAGVTYDLLNKAALSALKGEPLDEESRAVLGIGRQNSAHHVFAGAVRMVSAEGLASNFPVMIKTHVEGARNPHKPFKELGNMAMLQSVGQPGIYKPVALLQSEGLRFVVTEFRSGVRTLDDRAWYGKQPKGRRINWTPETQEHEVELLSRAFSLLGSLHAQGIFHLDAQPKNIGWTILGFDSQREEQSERGVRMDSLDDIQMTIVDMENARVFRRETDSGDFPQAYYAELPDLATKDVQDLFRNLPKFVRMSREGRRDSNHDEEPFIMARFVGPYVQGFLEARAKEVGPEAYDEELAPILTTYLVQSLIAINQAKTGSRQAAKTDDQQKR